MYDVIIVGAGAAGLMCALTAGRRGRRVLLLDHNNEAGAKILISGGGRCNFTNTGTTPDKFLSDNPHFSRSALGRYTPRDFIALVEKHRITYHEKTLGQLFCDGSATAIVRMLLDECAAAGVHLKLGCRVTAITPGYEIATDHGTFTCESLVLATGGLSIPKLGATGFAYDIARQFGLRLTAIKPALVPLCFGNELLALMRPLAGVSFEGEISHGRARFREACLFTHRGMSGPAVLQISSYAGHGEITVNMLPGQNPVAFLLDRKKTRPKAELRTVLGELLPQRLAGALACEIVAPAPEEVAPVPRLADLPDRVLRALGEKLAAWRITPCGDEGYVKAEVTKGGIDTRDLSSRTMMANEVPGLFAIGEAVDVTGWLGGYNFQWAWASGAAAGEHA